MPLTKRERISAKKFASVPALDNLPAIHRTFPLVPNAPSPPGVVDISEGCLITKTIKYTHKLSYWVKAARNDDAGPLEAFIKDILCVIPRTQTLFGLSNIALFDPFVYSALEIHAFIAITASLATLDNLIHMVRSDNVIRQQEMDSRGVSRPRMLDFTLPCFTNPEYELVALLPEHFLPRGSPLTVYDPNTATYKHYVVAVDRRLRETSDPGSPRLPPFRHISSSRKPDQQPNIFLVVINAEFKFNRYFTLVEATPPITPLPPDVIHLMQRTMDLADLIYWNPVQREEGSRGVTTRQSDSRPESVEMIQENQDMEIPDSHPVPRDGTGLEDMDLDTGMEYGRALMRGYYLGYEPDILEDAFQVTGSHHYFEKNVMEA